MPTTGRATGNENEEFSTLVDLLKKYPDVEYNQISGEFVRRGYKGITPVTQRIGLVTMDYYAGGTLETESKESPDVLPAMVYTPAFGSGHPASRDLYRDRKIVELLHHHGFRE